MKAILQTIAKILKGQRGFTLVEMVTVVAIMGVMAAVAVPMVSSQLGKTREKSYLQDKAMIQTSVDSYFTAADNARYLGQRQYPILGSSALTDNTFWQQVGDDQFDNARTDDATPPNVLTGTRDTTTLTVDLGRALGNPLRGTQGGMPKWRDEGDSNRAFGTDDALLGPTDSGSEENLNGETGTLAGTGSGWYLSKKVFQGKEYAADTRNYFIDFDLLVKAGLLQKVPESASRDNGGGDDTKGSYSWYVNQSGQVESVYYFFPSNGLGFDGETSDGTLDLRGFFDGVYP